MPVTTIINITVIGVRGMREEKQYEIINLEESKQKSKTVDKN